MQPLPSRACLPAGSHVLALGQSATLLALLAAQAGCGRATVAFAVEQCPLQYHAGKLLLGANAHLVRS